MSAAQYTLDELVRASGFSRRRIRFYITRGLVPGAGDRRGPHAAYPADALRRLERLAELKQRRLPPTGRRLTLEEIRHELDADIVREDTVFLARAAVAPPACLDADDPLHALLDRFGGLLGELAADPRPADADSWRRLSTPDLEIHVRRPGDPAARRRLAALADSLRQLLADGGTP